MKIIKMRNYSINRKNGYVRVYHEYATDIFFNGKVWIGPFFWKRNDGEEKRNWVPVVRIM